MTRAIPPTSSVSTLRGLWFVFQHAGNQFGLWISSLTGKEELYLNGTLVAERRKIALTSVHQLAVSGATYTLELRTPNLRRGVYECVLRENGMPVAALATEYIVHRRAQQNAVVALGAAVVLYTAFKTGASFELAALGIVAVCVLSYAWLGKHNGYVIRPVQLPSWAGSGSEV